MLRYRSVRSILTAATVMTSDAAAQSPAVAGVSRPKLQVLQALPESQLFPLMNLIAASLGVRCELLPRAGGPESFQDAVERRRLALGP